MNSGDARIENFFKSRLFNSRDSVSLLFPHLLTHTHTHSLSIYLSKNECKFRERESMVCDRQDEYGKTFRKRLIKFKTRAIDIRTTNCIETRVSIFLLINSWKSSASDARLFYPNDSLDPSQALSVPVFTLDDDFRERKRQDRANSDGEIARSGAR